MRRGTACALALLVAASPAAAQQLELGGQLRPRFEVRDPVPGVETLEFTSMRTRASLLVTLEDGITGFIQLQDVRVFGEEASTLTDYSADGLDIHQAWAELGDPASAGWSVRVGRQEAAYGGERLIGAVNWTQQARAFDGVRVRYRPSADAAVDAVAFQISDSEAGTGAAADRSFYGLYGTVAARGDLDLFALWDRTDALVDRDLVTLGGRWASGREDWSWRAEAAYQTGSTEAGVLSRDISAFMVGLRVGSSLSDALRATLWYDYLSGDDDPGDDVTRVFDTLFATNHKFYGYQDLFLNIPAATGGRGLQDLALKTSYDVDDDQTLSVDFHLFRLAAADQLDSGRLGEELDLTYRWAYRPGVAVTGGFSYFAAADAWSTFLGNPDDNQVWGYLMLDLVF